VNMSPFDLGLGSLTGLSDLLLLCGAGLFMWFCVVTFFTKFCILIVSTIGFSLNAALFFFMPLTAIVGPAGDQGSLTACCAGHRAARPAGGDMPGEP
jgi:hypothetical protein